MLQEKSFGGSIMFLCVVVYVCGWEEAETEVDLWDLWLYTTQGIIKTLLIWIN